MLSEQCEGQLPLRVKKSLQDVGFPVTQAAGVDSEVFVLPVAIEDAVRYLAYFMPNELHFLILNYELYKNGENWEELDKFDGRGADLPLVLSHILNSTAFVLGIVRLKPPAS